MSTSIEQVWAHVKQAARTYGRRGVVPSQAEAHKLIAHFVARERCDPQPPPEAIDFLAAELIDLAAHERRTRAPESA